jgi:predicted Zn-dependent protease
VKKPAAAEKNKADSLEPKKSDTPDKVKAAVPARERAKPATEVNKLSEPEANKAAAPEVNKPPEAETKKTAGKSVQHADAPDAQRREIAAAASRPAPAVTQKKEPEKQPETRTGQAEGVAQAPGAEPVADAAAGLSPVEQWKQRIAAEPQNAELRFAFAGALVTGGLYDDAIKVLLNAAGDFPSNAQVYWHLGQAYWQQGFHRSDGAPRAGMERTAYRNCVLALETFVARAGAGEANVPQAQSLLDALRRAKK